MSAATGVVRFCFADVDPATGTPYARTPFADLPGFAAAEDFIDPDQQWEVGPAEAAAACQPDIDTIAVIGW